MLHAICTPPAEDKYLIGQYYLSSILDDVRYKHSMRQSSQQQMAQVGLVG